MMRNLDLIPNLTAVSASPRHVMLINQSAIFWSSAIKVLDQKIYPMSHLYAPQMEDTICMIKILPLPFPQRKDVLISK